MRAAKGFALLVEQLLPFRGPVWQTLEGGDELGMFGMSISCWLAIDF